MYIHDVCDCDMFYLQELESRVIPLLLTTPNSQTETGNNRDRSVQDTRRYKIQEFYSENLHNIVGVLQKHVTT